MLSLFTGSRSTMHVNISSEPFGYAFSIISISRESLDCALSSHGGHSAVLICVYCCNLEG